MSIIDTLITDRTQADVTKLKSLLSKPKTMWKQEEWSFFLGGPAYLMCIDGPLECTDGYLTLTGTETVRGAYNATDLNRVQEAMEYLAERFRSFGYTTAVRRPDINGRDCWKIGDIPRKEHMDLYLGNLAILRSTNAVLSSTPEIPKDMDGLTYGEANDIEQILIDIDYILTVIYKNRFFTAEVFSGEV